MSACSFSWSNWAAAAATVVSLDWWPALAAGVGDVAAAAFVSRLVVVVVDVLTPFTPRPIADVFRSVGRTGLRGFDRRLKGSFMFEGSAVERSLRPDDGVDWFNSRALLRCGAIERVEPVFRLEKTSFSFRPAAAVSGAGWVSSTERCLFLLGPGAPMPE